MTDLNKTYCSILLSNARAEAKEKGVHIPKGLTTYCYDGNNPFFEVWSKDTSGIVWSGNADNANHAKANYISALIDILAKEAA